MVEFVIMLSIFVVNKKLMSKSHGQAMWIKLESSPLYYNRIESGKYLQRFVETYLFIALPLSWRAENKI